METEAPEDPKPQAKFILRIGQGHGICTPDRPTPVLQISFSFGGSDHETETITGTSEPDFKFQKEFNLDANEMLIRDLICNPVVFKIHDTKPVGKTQEKIVIGKVTVNLVDLVFWKEQTEEEEMASTVSMTGSFPVPELGANANLTLFFQAPEEIIPKEELDKINVLTFQVQSLHALPPTWALKEGEDPNLSTFSYTASYSIPLTGDDGASEKTISLPAASIVAATVRPPSPSPDPEQSDGAPPIQVAPTDEERKAILRKQEDYTQRLVWNHTFTTFLSAADTKRIKSGFSNPLDIHVRRGLKSNNPYPYARRYHGIAKVDTKALLAPGTSVLEGRFDVVPAPDAEDPLTEEETALLPDAAAAPAGKGAAKPAAVKGKGAPTGPEFEVEPTPDPEKPHPFVECLTYIKVRFNFLRPLIPAPPPPKPPLPRVSELIPHRPYMPPHKPPMDASEDFCKQISAAVEEIADEYVRMFDGTSGYGGVVGGDNTFGTIMSNTTGSGGQGATSMGGEKANLALADERRQRLAYYLTKNGAYYSLKERLKYPVQRIVRERFHKTGNENAEELKVFCNELYVYLCTLLNQVLNKRFEAAGALAGGGGIGASVSSETVLQIVSNAQQDGASPDISKRIEHYHKLAEEAEMILRMDLAATHHSQRVVLCKHREDLWYDFGAFCMRTHDLTRAEECLREAIALNPKHLMSLLTYGALICTRDKINAAETYFVGAAEAYPEELLPVALMGFFYDMENRDTDRRKAFKRLLELEKKAGEQKSKSAYVRAAAFLNTIHCTQLVERALSQELLKSGETVEICVLLGTAYLNRLDHENARKHLNNVLKNLDKRCGIAMCLMGHSFFLTKQVKEAVGMYEQALALRTPYIEIALYMRLALLYAGMNKQFEAKDYYLKACKLYPTASSWLGLGMACFNMNQYGEAEEALAEANILDSHNPEVWGWLTILSLKTGKIEEAEASYRECQKHNLVTVNILREIGRGYMKHGKFSVAEAALRKAMLGGEDATVYRLLGDVLTEYHNLDGAIELYKKVIVLARTGDDRRHSLRQLVSHSKALNRPDDAVAFSQLPDVATA